MRLGLGLSLDQAGGVAPMFAVDFTSTALGAGAISTTGLAFTRASTATVQTSATTVVTGVGVDTPRFGSDGTRRGLVIEGARTNYAFQSTTLGAPWVNYNGVTISIGGGGTAPDGSTASTRLTDPNGAAASARYVVSAASASKQISSGWARPKSGVEALLSNYDNAGTAIETFAYSTTADEWQKLVTSTVVANTTGPTTACWPASDDPRANAPTGDGDFWGLQCEIGEYATELIPTTAGSASRSGDRLTMTAARYVDNGRVEVEIDLYAKGASSEYVTDGAYVYLLYVDADNFVRVDTATRRLEVRVAASTWSPATAMTWSRGDRVRFRVAAGGGVLSSRASYAVNGGAWTSLGTNAAQGTWPSSTADVLSAGTASQLACWLRSVRTYRAGRMP